MSQTTEKPAFNGKRLTNLPAVTICFAGDSGDGMQLAGTQFSDASALAGNDIATLPDFPSEIRAPGGTVAGVSGYQIQFASHDIYTPGDRIDVLVAMNPAALKVNLDRVQGGGILIANSDAFNDLELGKAGYTSNPLEDDSLSGYTVHKVPVSRMTAEAVVALSLSPRTVARCRNMFMLGLVCWLYDRPLEQTLQFIERKFAKNAELVDANRRAFKAGYNFGETAEMFPVHYHVDSAPLAPGTYRRITGNQAVALGLATAARLAGTELLYASYPITPASEILHELSALKSLRVVTFQAEDEIAAAGAAIGAAFGGRLAATGTSGPGLALKSEALGLAVMAELPLVVINVQRGGPSTGLPTKTEQSDLLQALDGRHGECPMVVLAATGPGDCFDIVVEASRIAIRYMVPVLVLTDGYLAFGAEPWRVPDFDAMARIPVQRPDEAGQFAPYARNEDLARPWATPGVPGLMHRLGGLEKQDVTGQLSHDPSNHQRMVKLRAEKVAGVKMQGPAYHWLGADSGPLLIVGWGSTYGAIVAAVQQAQGQGLPVAACHVRSLNPLPQELGERMRKFNRVLVAELNSGQLRRIVRDQFLVDAGGINKIQGQPFAAAEILAAIESAMKGESR